MPTHWFDPTKQWLSHPLFIALATVAFTAILGAILVPYLTSQWQVSERELDVKFDLAKEVSDTVITTLMRPFRFHNINYSSIESVNAITPKIVEGAIEVSESCDSTRQRLLLYFPGNDRLRKEWGDICTSLTFFYWYRTIPREVDIGTDLFNNVSMVALEIVDSRLGLDLNQAELKSLAAAEKRTMTREIYGTITNKTQTLMHDIIRSNLVGY